jgi:hypothetical protein
MSSAGKISKNNINLSKGIILGFFTIFLIAYGIFISFFIEIYPGYQGSPPPFFMTYIPLVCYIGAIFLGFGLIIFIRNVTIQKSRVVQSRKKTKRGSIYKEALFIIIFIFAFIPLLGPIFDQGKNDQNFSIYNEDWNGASYFRQFLIDEGYDVMSVQSSLSATERLDKSILLILLGPNQFYNPVFEIPYFVNFFSNETTNSILICHDHGSTSTLLWEIFISSALVQTTYENIPVTIFPEGILRDNASYYKQPDFPVIINFPGHPVTTGITSGYSINQIILSESSAALGGDLVSFFGWNVVGYSTKYGYLDRNNDHVFNINDDYFDTSIFGGLIPGMPQKYGLGGQKQAVFMAKDIGTGRIFVSADASLFNNELIIEPGYDNLQFGKNIVEWLTYIGEGGNKDDWVIVFDEAHIRPEYSRDLTSAGIYGFITQYVIHLSTNPITAWIYPLLAVYTLKKYLPKKSEKEEKKKAEQLERIEEKERFRTSSFFAEKIKWYREKNRYDKALTLLNRRLDRKLNALLRGKKISTKNVAEMVISKDPKITKSKIKRISRFIDRMLSIKEGKSKVRNEQDFEDLFFEMEWVVNNL